MSYGLASLYLKESLHEESMTDKKPKPRGLEAIASAISKTDISPKPRRYREGGWAARFQSAPNTSA
jgi:hypothetical protein